MGAGRSGEGTLPCIKWQGWEERPDSCLYLQLPAQSGDRTGDEFLRLGKQQRLARRWGLDLVEIMLNVKGRRE